MKKQNQWQIKNIGTNKVSSFSVEPGSFRKPKSRLTNFIKGGLTILISVLIIFTVVKAGTITPPSDTPSAQFYTLSEIYTRLTTNATSTAGGHSFTFADSLTGTSHTLTEIYDAIPTIVANTVKLDTIYLGVTGTLVPSGGTAATTDVLSGKKFFGDSQTDWTLQTGTMANNGSFILTCGVSDQSVTTGYYSGGTLAGDAYLVSGNIKSGITIFSVDGDGNVVDTSSGDAVLTDILSGKKCWVDGAEVTGNITAGANVSGGAGELSFTITDGLYSGSKTCTAVDGDLTVGNIKSGVNIFGTVGTMPPGAMVATGQVTSYATNDDGTYEKGLALSYTDNGDGTITDNNTLLMWVKEPQKIIPGAALAGIATNQIQTAKGDWTTSTAYVLGDLVRDATGANATAANISAATAASPCVLTVDGLQGITTGQSVLINNITDDMGDILNGNIYYVVVDATAKTLILYSNAACSTKVDTTGKTYTSGGMAIQTKFYVCAVAHTSGTFTTDVGAGDWRETVWTASAAGLTIPSTMAWLPTGGSADAINNCENLTYGGYTDWRLPNIKELQNIVDYGEYSPAIIGSGASTYFPNTQSSYYWSSTTYALNPSGAWYVRFSNGYVYSLNKTYSYYVRCLRGQ